MVEVVLIANYSIVIKDDDDDDEVCEKKKAADGDNAL